MPLRATRTGTGTGLSPNRKDSSGAEEAAVEDLPFVVEFGQDRSGESVEGGEVGKTWTTSARRLASRFSRARGMVDQIFFQCTGGKSTNAVISVAASSSWLRNRERGSGTHSVRTIAASCHGDVASSGTVVRCDDPIAGLFPHFSTVLVERVFTECSVVHIVREPSLAPFRARTVSVRRLVCTAATSVGLPTPRSATSPC